MNNLTGLREELFGVFRNVLNKTLEPKVAKEANNAAGKIISSAKVQLEYHALRKEKPKSAFFA